MKRIIIAAAAAALFLTGACSKYQTVKGDPMQTRIYTLDNGLKVYMTVNHDEPRIQTYIAVRSGGKNDPADNTGLAHYLEHMMFKGSEAFGTTDYSAEQPLLSAIDSLFEVYRTKTDNDERLAIYHVIDSISFEASRLAIPNEYDKMMSIIGSEGSNAYTSNDVTCYVENIPSNQVDNWARIQADRFMNSVFRGFHTELEAVYEEKNMGLVRDSEKAIDALDSMLFARHPYGTQTVIGTQEHLKNPSLKAIRYQKDTYYVPNNTAICLSGDFNPDEMVKTIEKYFGAWQPNPSLPVFTYEEEEPVTTQRIKEVVGSDAEFVFVGWRTPGEKDTRSEVGSIATSILYNGMAGLMDINVNNAQKALFAGAFVYDRTDYDVLLAQGQAKAGQSLEEVKDLILGEAAKLREGDFDDELVTATINNIKLQEMRSLESNADRADKYVTAFINGTPWETASKRMSRIERITKADVVAWAQEFLGENSCAIVYKRIGEDKSIKKIDAPRITPIVTNRDKQSDFLASVAASEVKPIEPIFVDYTKDLTVNEKDGITILYRHNDKNDIARLNLRFNIGTATCPALSMASDYLALLGTADMTNEAISKELYNLATSYDLNVGAYSTSINISGLSENIGKTLDIVEGLITSAVADEDILAALKDDLYKARKDAKMNQRACNGALQRYIYYGPDYIKSTTLTNEAVAALTSEDILGAVRNLLSLSHEVLYYGPDSQAALTAMLSEHHQAAAVLAPVEKQHAQYMQTAGPKVIVANYPSRQFNYIQYSNRGETYNAGEAPLIRLYNTYFGGGMNAIVFQEMRESRALAYSAGALLAEPGYTDQTYWFRATIGSQNDKLRQAVEAFDDIINNMPQSEANLEIAKSNIESDLRTGRTTGMNVLYSYLDAQDLGLSEPVDKLVFEHLDDMTMDNLNATQQKWIKGRKYVYAILGDTSDLDMAFLRTLGPVQTVSLEEIFGY